MKKILIAIAVIAVFLFAWHLSAKNDFAGLYVVFLDVGQGDSIFIRTPSGQNIIIDGGPDNQVLYEIPRYMKWWDRTIDLMILTHPHDDHIFGLIEILKRYKVKKVVYTGVFGDSPVYEAWKKALTDKNPSIYITSGKSSISLDEDCNLDLVYPAASIENKNGDLNDTSVVSLLDCENVRFLFTGDIEGKAESDLSGNDIEARVLKVAHHGSDTSSSGDFLTRVSPEYAVISVGQDNKYGHPSLRVINRLERFGIKILRTDVHGTAAFKIEDGNIKIER